MRSKSASTAAAIVLCLGLGLAVPGHAAGSPDAELRAEIDSAIKQAETNMHGVFKWDGAEHMDVRADGDAAVADISNARILIQNKNAQPPMTRARINLDHIEVRRAPRPDGLVDISINLPANASIQPADGEETKVTLKDGTVHLALDPQTERARELVIAIAGARVEDKTGDWATFGPLSASTKVSSAADNSWNQPFSLEFKQIEAFFAKNRAGGTIEHIAYSGRGAGPDLPALYRLSDRMKALQNDIAQNQRKSPQPQDMDALFGMLGEFFSLFSQMEGELTVENAAARGANAAPLFSLGSASLATKIDGTSGDKAMLRVTYKHDGLELGPMLPVGPGRVPRQAVLDFGVEDVATAPLKQLIEAAAAMHKAVAPADKQRATQQMLGAAAMLTPDFHIYDLVFDTQAFGIKGTAEAKGSPISPKGYSAQGDVSVRSLDALPNLFPLPQIADYVPLLQVIGEPAKTPDGAPLTRFHLISAPPKWVAINGNDLSAWFLPGPASSNAPRRLRVAEPPLSGDDVRAVQKALFDKAAGVPQQTMKPGIYDGATAAAVARFQKSSGLNVDGVVDVATRDKLGIKAESAHPTPARPN